MADAEVFELIKLGRVFATRSQAKEIAKRFEEFSRTSQAEILVVGWDDVHAASPSFIDEFVGGVGATMNQVSPTRNLVFSGDDDYIMELVGTILRRRKYPVDYVPSSRDVGCGPHTKLGLPVESDAVLA